VTTLLSLMYKGQVETLSPSLDFFEGHLTVIRPLILVRESEITRYARASGWDLPPELSCPQGEQSRRVQIERFLGTLKGKERRNVRANLWRAGRKAMGF
jgi:tRNA(Ile)-lysidine synthase TilS/MesJ